MKNRTIQIITLLAIIAMTGIVVLQVFWFRKAFDVHEKEFDQNVFTSLQRVAEQILQMNNQQIPNARLVDQLSGNYFVVSVNGEIDTKVLESLLRAEFRSRGLTNDFEYGVYDCNHQKLVYGNYVSFHEDETVRAPRELPQWKNDLYYFSVNFPDKSNHLIDSMSIWLFSSLVLLMVVMFFAFALITIFRQKQLSEVQKDFVNNMTHEFKTPVSTILVTSKLLNKPEIAGQPDAIDRYSKLIQQEAMRLKTQVERVLQVAVWDQKKMKYRMEPVNIHDCLQEALFSMEQIILDKGGTLEKKLAATHPVIKGDKMHLTNTFFNLLDNAVKYSERPPEIEVITVNTPKHLEIVINDNGIGIQQKNLRHIFDRFFRVSTGDVHDVKGFGLGLYYVKHVVKDHHGSILVTSQPGSGTSVSIIFPQKN